MLVVNRFAHKRISICTIELGSDGEFCIVVTNCVFATSFVFAASDVFAASRKAAT